MLRCIHKNKIFDIEGDFISFKYENKFFIENFCFILKRINEFYDYVIRRSGNQTNFAETLFKWKKKLVTRLSNFSDRVIKYESFLLKNIVTNKKNWNFLIFLRSGRGRGSFFIEVENKFSPANLAPYCTY